MTIDVHKFNEIYPPKSQETYRSINFNQQLAGVFTPLKVMGDHHQHHRHHHHHHHPSSHQIGKIEKIHLKLPSKHNLIYAATAATNFGPASHQLSWEPCPAQPKIALCGGKLKVLLHSNDFDL
jgi:Fe2+ or Zn2+ uptake regulation protein